MTRGSHSSFHRHAITIICMLALSCLPTCGCGPGSRGGPDTPAASVVTARLQRRDISRTIELPGDVQAFQQAELYAKVSGYLRDVLVDKGDRVTAGQLLATIDLPETRHDVREAEAVSGKGSADLQAAHARVPEALAEQQAWNADYQRAMAQLQQARADEQGARAQSAQASAELDMARLSYQRLKGVYDIDTGLVARQELDIAETAQKVAEARVEAARQAVASARQNVVASTRALEAAKSKLSASSSHVRVARAEAESLAFESSARHEAASRAQVTLDYGQIRAPFSGIITGRTLDPGALVQSAVSNAQGATKPIFTIADYDRVRILIETPEREAPFVEQGTPAEIIAEAFPGRPFRGRVTRTAGALDPNSRTMLTEVDLANPKHRLKPGMYVKVRLVIETHRGALAIPAAAIIQEKERSSVFVVDKGVARKIPLTTGFREPGWIEITGGMQGTEEIVVRGPENLQSGSAVEPLPAR
jgi:HlyD family secretion protein